VQGFLLGRPARALAVPAKELLESVPRGDPPSRPSQRIALGAMAEVICREALVMAGAPAVPAELRSMLGALHDILVRVAS